MKSLHTPVKIVDFYAVKELKTKSDLFQPLVWTHKQKNPSETQMETYTTWSSPDY